MNLRKLNKHIQLSLTLRNGRNKLCSIWRKTLEIISRHGTVVPCEKWKTYESLDTSALQFVEIPSPNSNPQYFKQAKLEYIWSSVVNCFQKFSIFAVWNSLIRVFDKRKALWIAFKSLVSLRSETVSPLFTDEMMGLWIAFKSLVSLRSETVTFVRHAYNSKLWIAFKSLVSLRSETVAAKISFTLTCCELLSKV